MKSGIKDEVVVLYRETNKQTARHILRQEIRFSDTSALNNDELKKINCGCVERQKKHQTGRQTNKSATRQAILSPQQECCTQRFRGHSR